MVQFKIIPIQPLWNSSHWPFCSFFKLQPLGHFKTLMDQPYYGNYPIFKHISNILLTLLRINPLSIFEASMHFYPPQKLRGKALILNRWTNSSSIYLGPISWEVRITNFRRLKSIWKNHGHVTMHSKSFYNVQICVG